LSETAVVKVEDAARVAEEDNKEGDDNLDGSPDDNSDSEEEEESDSQDRGQEEELDGSSDDYSDQDDMDEEEVQPWTLPSPEKDIPERSNIFDDFQGSSTKKVVTRQCGGCGDTGHYGVGCRTPKIEFILSRLRVIPEKPDQKVSVVANGTSKATKSDQHVTVSGSVSSPTAASTGGNQVFEMSIPGEKTKDRRLAKRDRSVGDASALICTSGTDNWRAIEKKCIKCGEFAHAACFLAKQKRSKDYQCVSCETLETVKPPSAKIKKIKVAFYINAQSEFARLSFFLLHSTQRECCRVTFYDIS
jgi:hypothetical protein